MPDSSLSLSPVIAIAPGNAFRSIFRSAKDTLSDLGETAAKMRPAKPIFGNIVPLNRKPEGQHSIGSSKSSVQPGNTQRGWRAPPAGQGSPERETPVVGALYSAGRALGRSMDIERQTIRLRTVINAEDGDVDAAVERAVAHARETARNTLASESELLQIQYRLNAAGLQEEAARVGSDVVAKVAKVISGDVGQVAKVMGAVHANMGESMARIGDVLTKTQFKFAGADFGQLGAGMAKAASGAIAAKLPLEQTAAAIGTLNIVGLDGSQAGAALNAVLSRMGTASDELGFSMARGADGSLDLGATLQALHERLPDPADSDARSAAIQRLFGDEGKAGLQPLLEGLDKYRDGLQSVSESTGVVDDAYRRFIGSAGGQWTMLAQNLTAIGSTIGGTMLPTINLLLTPLARGAGLLGKLVEESSAVGAALGVVTGAFATLGTVWAGFAWFGKGEVMTGLAKKTWALGKGALPHLGAALKTAGSWMLRLGGKALPLIGAALRTLGGSLLGLATRAVPVVIGGIRALGAAMLTNPIGLTITGIALAATLIYKYWEPLKDFFGGVWAGIEAGLQPVADAIKPAFAALWAAVKPVFAAIGAAVKPVIDWFRKFLSPVESAQEELAGVAGVGKTVGRVIAGLATVLGAVMFPFISLPVLIFKYWEPIKGFFGGLGASLKGALSGLWTAVKGALGGVWESIEGWFGRLDMASLGRALIETLAAGIRFSPVGLIYKALKSVLGHVGKLLPESDAQEGPLSRLTAAGGSIVGTLGAGVRRAGPHELRRPLGRALAGAAAPALALTLSVPALPAARPPLSTGAQSAPQPSTVVHAAQHGGVYVRELVIHQQRGEDARDLVERILAELNRRRRQARREALYDYVD